MLRSQIGQRTLIIGRTARRLRGFPRRFPGFRRRGARGGIGRTVGGGFIRRRLGAFLLRLRRRLVRLAAVVRLVETRPLENHRRPGADQAPQLELAALGALLQGRIAERLKLVKIMLTCVALVFVSRHGILYLFVWMIVTSSPPKRPPWPGAGPGRGA